VKTNKFGTLQNVYNKSNFEESNKICNNTTQLFIRKTTRVAFNLNEE